MNAGQTGEQEDGPEVFFNIPRPDCISTVLATAHDSAAKSSGVQWYEQWQLATGDRRDNAETTDFSADWTGLHQRARGRSIGAASRQRHRGCHPGGETHAEGTEILCTGWKPLTLS